MSIKRVAVIQSNYIPWKGYFDIVNMVDLFVFHDDLQYTKGDWRNRNVIKTAQGLRWLTIPCGANEHRLICEVELNDHLWQAKHWGAIQASYRSAPYFNYYRDFFAEIYLGRVWRNLSELNQFIVRKVSRELLDITTEFADSRDYNLGSRKAERVIELIMKCGATEYVSGPAAKSYLNEEMLEDVGAKLEWMDYSGYPCYEQLYPPFIHQVSIVDLLFSTGPSAREYMLSFKMKPPSRLMKKA